MGGQVVPPTAFDIEPMWRNFFENAGLVQFIHRSVGYVLLAFGLFVWVRARRSANAQTRFAFNAVAAMMVVQMLLGIMTVLYLAPLSLALLHQVGAVVLFALILRARFLSHYPISQTVRG